MLATIAGENLQGVKFSQAGVTIELQKKELKAKIQSGSLVARRALSQWNKLNTTIRGVVGTMKFHGSGGLSKCEGTSQEEALLNQSLRKEITDREDVKSLYEVFVLEDGCGKVTLDHLKAGDHVRTVLNNRKRILPDSPIIPLKEQVQDDQRAQVPTPAQTSTDTTKGIQSPALKQNSNNSAKVLRTRRTTAVTNGKQRKSNRGKFINLNEKEKDNEKQEDFEEDRGLPAPSRCDYELKRAENVKKNLAILSDLGLTSKVLEEGDAMLVARVWFEESHGKKLRLCHVIQEATDLGLTEIPKDKSFRSALVMFGNEVVKEQLVELTKEGGLEKENIILVGK